MGGAQSSLSEDDLGPYEYKNVYRSQDMTFVRIVLNDQNKHLALKAIGRLEVCHLVHDSSLGGSQEHIEFKRRIQDCNTLLRRINSIEESMTRFNIVPVPVEEAPRLREGDVTSLANEWLAPLEADIHQHSQFLEQITNAVIRQYEYTQVLKLALELTNSTAPVTVVTRRNVGTVQSSYSDDDLHQFADAIPLISLSEPRRPPPSDNAAGVVHIYGVVPTTLRSLLERTVFRIARGNIYMTWKDNTSSDIVSVTPDASTGALAADITVPPTLSFSFKLPPGSELYKRILRTCQTIGARVYDIPQTTNPGDIETVLARVDEEAGRQLHARMQTTAVLQQLFQVAATESTSVEAAEETGAPQLLLSEWQALVLQERHITLALSQAERSTQGASTVCVLRAWVPSHRMDCLEAGLAASVQGTDVLPPLLQVPNDGQIAEGANPPTRFDTTCFWLPFQMMVDTYGVPTYKEANPGLIAAVTFPFLFGVMFGDVFHGACLAIAGAIGLTIFRGRYRAEHEDGVDEAATPYAHEKVPAQAKLHVGLWMMLLLMGLFAVYAGLIYNDCAALPLHMGVSPLLDDKSHGPYSFGIDPGYYHTASELPVLNSFKMKMSVIIGVLHMTFGLGIGVSNHLYRGRTHMLWLESVPRITLLMATFGYMISIIVYKWTVDWSTRAQSPPSLIQTMINMFLAPGTVLPSEQLYPGQAVVQLALLLIAGVCVPIIFFGEPVYNYLTWRALHHGRYSEDDLSDGSMDPLAPHSASGSSYSTFPQSPALPPAHGQPPQSYNIDLDDEDLSADGDGYGEGEGHSLIRSRHNSGRDSSAPVIPQSNSVKSKEEPKEGGTDPRDPNYSFSADLIHHAIHAIEFVLGTVSNTASYLRLWALSLAHAQLAQVFFNKMLLDFGVLKSPLMTFAAMAAWLASTVGVLLFMDVLEASLHATRLLWVEFQSKFYDGQGYAFQPFSVRFDSKADAH